MRDLALSLVSKGAHGFQGSGTILSQLVPNLPPPPYVFGQVGTIVFDGTGNFSASSIQNFGGATVPATQTGTYEVNSDCTAAWTVQTSLGLVVHDALVVTDRGQGFVTTETDSFAVVNRRGQKLGN